MFTHLHVHTQYSLLDGMCRIPKLVARAKELGMGSLAITDHGTMYGVIEFYLAAKEAGIKPIIGCEIYIAPKSRFTRDVSGKGHNHLILLAKNKTGFRNLLQLVTKAHLEGFYYKPKVDKELLEQHNQGLIALSACPSGEISSLILGGRLHEAKQAISWYQQTFDDFYLEIQRHPILDLEKINQELINFSTELNIPLVATSDVHYINKEDSTAHDLLLCIGTGSSIHDEKRMKMAGDFFYLKSPDEIAELFQDIPQAIENTEHIAEMCDLELNFGRLHLPELALPEDKNADQYLGNLCYEGLKDCYPQNTPEVKQRLDYELEVIKETQFANYFLVIWDIITFAKENGILFGVRGSAAASIALYCLGISRIDPIEHRLVFERFLNLERREMPDIDLDFQDDRRDEVIAYVSKKYGSDHVAQIITFGTLGARAALRDVGRALGMPYSFVDRIARLIPFGPSMTLTRAMEENEELKENYQQDPSVSNLIDSAKRLEGIARHASTHAAGIVISKEPLTQHVPLQQVSRGNNETAIMTQFSMDDIAKIGLLKMDILGLANLTILENVKEIICQHRDINIELHQIPMDDAKTFALLSTGETAGVFQLEGAGMRRYIRELKPTTFSDISAMVALYRPGPMEHIPTFIKAKHGLAPIRYPHPALTEILEETYGVIVYQEQVLFTVQTFAGYSLGQADIFRKAMGKKIPGVMKNERRNFIAGAKNNGFSTELASDIFTLIEPFAGYAFNKAHSVCYALIAYQTAYMKANYPVEYMAALLITHAGQSDKVANACAECRRLKINVLPPDINSSQGNFSIEITDSGSAIRFGLTAIKNVGFNSIESLLTEREKGGKFKSIEDFCSRIDFRGMNRRTMESLIKAGALTSLGDRSALLQNVNKILSLAQRQQQLKESGQSTMFDLWGEEVPVPTPSIVLATEKVPVKEILAWEKELTGVYLSEHPFASFAEKLNAETTLCGQIDVESEGQNVVVAGMVASVHHLFTRERKPFASTLLEDLNGNIEVMVWPKLYTDTKDLWQEGNILLVEGKVKLRNDKVQLYCDRVKLYSPEETQITKPTIVAQPKKETIEVEETVVPPTPMEQTHVTITITQTSDEESDVTRLNKLMDILKDFPGQDAVELRVTNEERVFTMSLPHTTIDYCPKLHEQLAKLIGEDGLKVAKNNN